MAGSGSDDGTDLDEQLAEAARLSEAGDPHSAFETLLALETRYPEDATVLCMLGLVASEADAPGAAYDYFRRALAAQPTDPSVLALLGTGLARFDDPDAESVLRLAAVTAPELALARLRYGVYLAREGLLSEAVDELEAARGLEPDDSEIVRELAIAYLLRGSDSKAADLLEAAGDFAAEEAEFHLLRGLALLRAQETAEAAEQLHQAAVESPDDGDAQIVAALACAAQGWTDEAWNAFARAEAAAVPAGGALLQEVEEALEGSPELAAELLNTQVAPYVLRDRLLDRP